MRCNQISWNNWWKKIWRKLRISINFDYFIQLKVRVWNQYAYTQPPQCGLLQTIFSHAFFIQSEIEFFLEDTIEHCDWFLTVRMRSRSSIKNSLIYFVVLPTTISTAIASTAAAAVSYHYCFCFQLILACVCVFFFNHSFRLTIAMAKVICK